MGKVAIVRSKRVSSLCRHDNESGLPESAAKAQTHATPLYNRMNDDLCGVGSRSFAIGSDRGHEAHIGHYFAARAAGSCNRSHVSNKCINNCTLVAPPPPPPATSPSPRDEVTVTSTRVSTEPFMSSSQK